VIRQLEAKVKGLEDQNDRLREELKVRRAQQQPDEAVASADAKEQVRQQRLCLVRVCQRERGRDGGRGRDRQRERLTDRQTDRESLSVCGTGVHLPLPSIPFLPLLYLSLPLPLLVAIDPLPSSASPVPSPFPYRSRAVDLPLPAWRADEPAAGGAGGGALQGGGRREEVLCDGSGAHQEAKADARP